MFVGAGMGVQKVDGWGGEAATAAKGFSPAEIYLCFLKNRKLLEAASVDRNSVLGLLFSLSLSLSQ